MAAISSMMNLGAEMSRKLSSVGIHSAEELMAVGAKAAFARLKKVYPKVCLVHLYTLEGAIEHVEYNALSPAKRADLKAFSDSLKQK